MNELDKNDRYWIWGLIYYDAGDPKLLVAKRYGWGWTFNFAHKGTWVFLLVIVGIIVAVKMLVR
jgi:uncharacterized membrane protein